MKKITILLVILMMLMSTGCTSGDKAPAVTTDAVNGGTGTSAHEMTTAPADGSTEESAPVTEDAEDDGITVYTESFTSGEIYVTLMYPVYGDGEHDAFDVAMRNYAVQKYNQSGMMPEDSAVYEILSCDVKYESEYFVSSVVTGTVINPTAAHDTHFAYTVNADTRSGKLYTSEELIGELGSLKTAVEGGRFTKSYGIDGLEDALANGTITYENDVTVSWRSDYGVYPDMYFTEENFGIIAELPHAVGGYAGFEIPYADVGDMINPVAKGLCGIIVTTK